MTTLNSLLIYLVKITVGKSINVITGKQQKDHNHTVFYIYLRLLKVFGWQIRANTKNLIESREATNATGPIVLAPSPFQFSTLVKLL